MEVRTGTRREEILYIYKDAMPGKGRQIKPHHCLLSAYRPAQQKRIPTLITADGCEPP